MSDDTNDDSNAIRLFAEALLSGRHPLEHLVREFCVGSDEAIDLTGRNGPEQLEEFRSSKVIPAPGVLAYLAGGDEITHAILDAAEIATERDYRLPEGWYVTSARDADPIRLRYLFLQLRGTGNSAWLYRTPKSSTRPT